MIQYRRATLADQPEILAMAEAFATSDAYRDLLTFHTESVQELIVYVLGDGVVWIADLEGQIVGMLAGVAVRHILEGTEYAEEIAWWVEPEFRNGRVGPKLLRLFEDWARQEGLSMVKMTAPADSDIGTFYERMDYRPLESSYIKRLPTHEG